MKGSQTTRSFDYGSCSFVFRLDSRDRGLKVRFSICIYIYIHMCSYKDPLGVKLTCKTFGTFLPAACKSLQPHLIFSATQLLNPPKKTRLTTETHMDLSTYLKSAFSRLPFADLKPILHQLETYNNPKPMKLTVYLGSGWRILLQMWLQQHAAKTVLLSFGEPGPIARIRSSWCHSAAPKHHINIGLQQTMVSGSPFS